MEKSVTKAGFNLENRPKYKEYIKRLNEIGNNEELEGDVYSHLTTFFKRYYDKKIHNR